MTTSPQANLQSLPYDVLIGSIWPLLELADLYNLSQTCRRLSVVVDDNAFWRRNIVHGLPHCPPALLRDVDRPPAFYRRVYFGLLRPRVYIWGAAAFNAKRNGRLPRVNPRESKDFEPIDVTGTFHLLPLMVPVRVVSHVDVVTIVHKTSPTGGVDHYQDGHITHSYTATSTWRTGWRYPHDHAMLAASRRWQVWAHRDGRLVESVMAPYNPAPPGGPQPSVFEVPLRWRAPAPIRKLVTGSRHAAVLQETGEILWWFKGGFTGPQSRFEPAMEPFVFPPPPPRAQWHGWPTEESSTSGVGDQSVNEEPRATDQTIFEAKHGGEAKTRLEHPANSEELVDIACGDDLIWALKANGELWVGYVETRSWTFLPHLSSPRNNRLQGSENTVAIFTDDDTWPIFARHSYRGCNPLPSHAQWVKRPEVTITEVAVDDDHVIALGDNGKVYSWGNTRGGCLGRAELGDTGAGGEVVFPDSGGLESFAISVSLYSALVLGDGSWPTGLFFLPERPRPPVVEARPALEEGKPALNEAKPALNEGKPALKGRVKLWRKTKSAKTSCTVM